METLLGVFWIREFGEKIYGIFRSDKVGNPLNFAIAPLDNLGQKLTGCGILLRTPHPNVVNVASKSPFSSAFFLTSAKF